MDNATQTNTREGDLQVIANEDLTGKEGCLAVLVEDTNVLEAKLPDAVTELALFIITEAATAGEVATLRPLCGNRNCRAELEGTCNPGDVLKLQAINGANDGKVCTLGSTPGQYFSPGVAEEEGVDGQLVRFRPFPRMVNIKSAHQANTAAAAGACAGGATPTATQVDAAIATAVAPLVTSINAILAALEVQEVLASS